MGVWQIFLFIFLFALTPFLAGAMILAVLTWSDSYPQIDMDHDEED